MKPVFSEQWLKDYQAVAKKHAVRGGVSSAGIRGRGDLGGGVTVTTTSLRGCKTVEEGTRSRVGNPAPSPYKSKWEAHYASWLALQQSYGHILWWKYEPFSLWLPGKVRYKPDFMVHRSTLWPSIEIIEVKGWSKNKRDGMTRLKIAAALFPCFQWKLARWTGRAFEVEEVVV